MSTTSSPAAAVSASARPRASAVAAYVALALTWGSSFLLIKVALGGSAQGGSTGVGFTVGGVAVGRIVLGAVALVVLMAVSRTRWPRERWLWAHLAVVGVLLCLAPFLLFSWAGEHLPSGLSAILNATTPIWTALAVTVASRSAGGSERLTRGQVAGVALGVVGVAVVMGLWRVVADDSFAASLPAQLACLGATACYGAGFAWMRRSITGRHGHGPLAVAAGQVGSAAVLGLLLSPLLVPQLVSGGGALGGVGSPGVGPVLALVALGVLGTGLAYVWSTFVLVEWGSLAAASVTYLTPVVGVLAGVLVLGERLTWNEPVGALVVVVSVLLVQKRWPRPSPAA